METIVLGEEWMRPFWEITEKRRIQLFTPRKKARWSAQTKCMVSCVGKEAQKKHRRGENTKDARGMQCVRDFDGKCNEFSRK